MSMDRRVTGAQARGEVVLILAVGIYLVLLIRTAWQADDAYTAWRLVDNLVNGYGLRNNIDERVQTFTSTIWTMVNAGVYYFSRNIYYTSIALSIVFSVLAVGIAGLPYRKDGLQIFFLAGAVTLSISFMDFSVGGFENPLSHLILASFAYVYFFRNENEHSTFLGLFVLAALAGLTRLDVLAYYFPALVLAFYCSSIPVRTKVLYAALGLSPLLLWHLFALLYFGFPLQNAAYAKRFNGIPTTEFVRAGVDYYLNSVSRDPVTLVTAALAMGVGLTCRGNRKLQVFTIGIPFYLLYVLYIGGDYMSGRFFSVALFASTIVVLKSGVLTNTSVATGALACTFVLGALAVNPTYKTGKDYGIRRELSNTSEWVDKGIADERASWYQHSGLLVASRQRDMPRPLPEWDFKTALTGFMKSMADGPCVGTVAPAGYFSFFAPRQCHIYDLNGQVDPLMARIPIRLDRNWRQGHLFRDPVPGYHETLLTGENRIVDPDLREYYEKLRLITRGEIWSWKRIKTIIRMNLGRYDHLLAAYAARNNITQPQ